MLIEESDLDHNIKLTHWRETVPLPLKVMAFGAARFAARYEGERDNTSLVVGLSHRTGWRVSMTIRLRLSLLSFTAG